MQDINDASKLSRRSVLKRSVGTAAALGLPHAGLAEQSSKSPDTRLSAERWVEALPIGNGRIGAMVFGGVDHERLQLNEDTLWSGGPYDPVNPDALAALPDVRRLVFAGRLREAQALANAKLMAKPLSQMSYQTLGDLFISLPTITANSVCDYERALDLDTESRRRASSLEPFATNGPFSPVRFARSSWSGSSRARPAPSTATSASARRSPER